MYLISPLPFSKPTPSGRIDGRDVADYCQPWHRPADGAAPAGGAQPARIEAGAAVQRSGHSRAVHALPAGVCWAVDVLQTLSAVNELSNLWLGVSHVHRESF